MHVRALPKPAGPLSNSLMPRWSSCGFGLGGGKQSERPGPTLTTGISGRAELPDEV